LERGLMLAKQVLSQLSYTCRLARRADLRHFPRLRGSEGDGGI
jgi:hypothetical protein